MSNVSSVQAARANEMQQKRYDNELKTLNTAFHDKYEDIIKKNTALLKSTQEDYEIKIVNLKSDLETKFNEMQMKHAQRIKLEQEKLENEIKELKQTHNEQKNEIKASHEAEIHNLRDTQQKFLDNARRNFEKRMAKYKA